MNYAEGIECLKDVFRYAIENDLCVFCGSDAFKQAHMNLELPTVVDHNRLWPIYFEWQGITVILNSQIPDLTIIARSYYAIQPLTPGEYKRCN